MPKQLTLEDAKQSLTAHVAAKGAEIQQKYGPHIGWKELHLIMEDRAYVRYPCELSFNDTPLDPGEFAHPVPKSANPEDGFVIHVHPFFSCQPAQVPLLVLYQLVLVNYGDFASPDDAEIFGAAALGISKEDYYSALCEMADLISEGVSTEAPPTPSSGCGGGCHCGS